VRHTTRLVRGFAMALGLAGISAAEAGNHVFPMAAAAYAQGAAERRFDALMRDLLIVDTHVDTLGYVVDEGYRLADEHRYYEADIPRLRRGHAGAVLFGVYVQPQDAPHLWLGRALEWIDALYEEARRNPRDLEVARTAADIVRIHGAGRIAALPGLEGGQMISNSLALLRDYYRLGVRYMTLTHFKTNDWADSSGDTAVHNGLTPFGREVVREMNRLGMMVDISHVSDKTFYDALEASRAPVIASHSSLRALCDIPRNMSDDMLRALARKGGVVFINFNVAYLDPGASAEFTSFGGRRGREVAEMMASHSTDPLRWEMRRAILGRYRDRLPKVDAAVLLRHIDHAVKTMGADHVGLGSDFDGVSGMVPAGVEDTSKYPVLVKGLIELGYSDADIRKIMGENLLRVLRAAETIAAEMAGR
jgi:membrane dipeptidase